MIKEAYETGVKNAIAKIYPSDTDIARIRKDIDQYHTHAETSKRPAYSDAQLKNYIMSLMKKQDLQHEAQGHDLSKGPRPGDGNIPKNIGKGVVIGGLASLPLGLIPKFSKTAPANLLGGGLLGGLAGLGYGLNRKKEDAKTERELWESSKEIHSLPRNRKEEVEQTLHLIRPEQFFGHYR